MVPVCKFLDFGLAKMGVAAAPGTIETRLATSPAPGRTASSLFRVDEWPQRRLPGHGVGAFDDRIRIELESPVTV
jgi:hypothetical protein